MLHSGIKIILCSNDQLTQELKRPLSENQCFLLKLQGAGVFRGYEFLFVGLMGQLSPYYLK